MTTSTTRIPSPGDLARRTSAHPPAQTAQQTATPKPKPRAQEQPHELRELTAAEAIAPGRLAKGERFKPMYHWGLMLSGLLPEARLLGYTLLWYARHTDGHISPTYQPNLDQLAAATGLMPARVAVQIEILCQRGWLRTTAIPTGPRAGGPRYDLTIPALYLERIRAKRAEREDNNRRQQTTT